MCLMVRRIERLILKNRFFAVALCVCITSAMTAGCAFGTGDGNGNTAASSGNGNTILIYDWNSDFEELFVDYVSDLVPSTVNIKFMTTSRQNGSYADALDNILAKQDTLDESNRVDLFLLDMDELKKYADSDYTMDVKKELGITDDELADQFDYTKELAADSSGSIKALSWLASPGFFAYRRSIAEDVLGTDDPEEVQKALSDWDGFDAVAKAAKDKGYYMLSDYNDAYDVFCANTSSPWVDAEGKISIDPAATKWVEQTENYKDSGYNHGTSMGDEQWTEDLGKSGKVFGFFCSASEIESMLISNSLEISTADGGRKEKGNGSYGDWAVCEGPESFVNGGTWIAAAEGSDNKELDAAILKRLTCDSDIMKQMTLNSGNFTNTVSGMREIADSEYESDFFGGQNHIALLADAVQKAVKGNTTEYDQTMNEEFTGAMDGYFSGSYDEETAYEDFYAAVRKKYPELSK